MISARIYPIEAVGRLRYMGAMRRTEFDITLTHISRWILVLAPVFLLTGVMGNELPASFIAVLFLLHSALARDWNWLRNRWLGIAILLWGYIVLRGAFAEFPHAALALSLPWIRFPIFAAAAAYWLLPDAATQRRLAITLVFSAAFLVADMLFQYHFGHDIFGRATFSAPGYTRLTGPFNKPRVGIIAAWMLLPALGFLSSACASHRRLLYILLAACFAVAGVVAIYLSGERMAFLLTLLGCGLLCLLTRRLWLIAPVVAILAVGAISYINATNPQIAARQVGASQQQISGFFQSPYGQILLSGIAMAKQHPLFGVGAGHFRLVCARADYGATDADSVDQRCANHTHNTYSEWLAEDGAIGLGLFLAMIAQWLRLAWNGRATLLRDSLAAGLFCVVAMRLFPAAASASQFVSWMAMPFWLIVGFLLARLATPPAATEHSAK